MPPLRSCVVTCEEAEWVSACRSVGRHHVETLLWPSRGVKCVVSGEDGGDTAAVRMVSCGAALLAHLPDTPVLRIITSQLHQYHAQYRCGCNTVLVMLSYWSESIADTLLPYGIAADTHQRLYDCLSQLIHTLRHCAQATTASAVINDAYRQRHGHDVPAARSVTHYSRHLAEANVSVYHILVTHRVVMQDCVRSFCHCDSSVARRAICEAWYNQLIHSDSQHTIEFHADRVHIHPTTLSYTSPKVIAGFITTCSAACLEYINAHFGRNTQSQALVMNGSLSPTYRHTGYKSSISSTSESATTIGEYVEQVTDIVRQMGITCILVHGTVEQFVEEVLLSTLGCVVVSGVPSEVLHSICQCTHVSTCTYVWECTPGHLVHGVTLQPCNDITTTSYHIAILLHSCHVQTIVVHHASREVLGVECERLWHALYRLQHMTRPRDEAVLMAGRGRLEALCVELLDGMGRRSTDAGSGSDSGGDVDKLVIDAIRGGFTRFINTLQHYMDVTDVAASSQRDITVYDDFLSKAEGWRLCLRIISLLMQRGQHIVTGLAAQTTDPPAQQQNIIGYL